MISFWTILIALSIVEAVVVAWILLISWKASRLGPVGRRLLLIAIVFLAQSLTSLWAYTSWMREGYGRDVAGPLLGLHLLILVGVATLADIVRR